MILPAIVVGIVGRAALRYAIGAGARYMAQRGAQAAIRRVMQRGLQQAQRRLSAERARLARCKNCKRLEDRVNPCQFLSRGNPLGSGPYRGGSHAGVKGAANREAHHIPASESYPPGSISYGRRPAIQMDETDHRMTASWGNKPGAADYRRRQASLLRQGKYMQAFAMDMADVMAQFPGKYDEALAEAGAYAACLERYGKTNTRRRR